MVKILLIFLLFLKAQKDLDRREVGLITVQNFTCTHVTQKRTWGILQSLIQDSKKK